ncbi:MAG: OmpA family protein [Deltaproteobacteria bacterium]|nr:OmpA family protein [Deltaproteobacteria bacterium]
MSRTWLLILLPALALACVPEYPLCRSDMQCKLAQTCVDGRCVQCADDSQCLQGEKCSEGMCEKPLDRCSSSAECAAGQVCLFELCTKCFEDEQCGSGMICVDGACAGCASDGDCGKAQSCVDGTCTEMATEPGEVITPEGCGLEPAYFEFDSFELTKEAKAVLDAWIPCLEEGRTYTLVGRADMTGDEGYNLSLGLDRAKAVKSYLVDNGVSSKNLIVATAGKHIAVSSEHETDRRVDIQ